MKQMEEKEAAFSRACIALLKGVVCRSSQEKLWQDILEQRNALKEYLSRSTSYSTLSVELRSEHAADHFAQAAW